MANSTFNRSKGQYCPICNLQMGGSTKCGTTEGGRIVVCRTAAKSYVAAPHGWIDKGLTKGGTEGVFRFYVQERAEAERYDQIHDGPVHYFPGDKIHTDAGSISIAPEPKAKVKPTPERKLNDKQRSRFEILKSNMTPIEAHPQALRRFAKQLGIPESMILEFDQAYFAQGTNGDGEKEEYLVIPEKNHRGDIIGLVTRSCSTGKKRSATGSSRGLTLPKAPLKQLIDHTPVLLVCEGQSDAMVLHAMGIPYIGRPSNTGGAEMIIDLLNSVGLPRKLQIIVLGENDQNTKTGEWPGKKGVDIVAAKLAKALHWPIYGAFPPNGIKDVRDWYIQRGKGRDDKHAEELRDEFLNNLLDNGLIRFSPGTGRVTDEDTSEPVEASSDLSTPSAPSVAPSVSGTEASFKSRLPSVEDVTAEFSSTFIESLPPVLPPVDVDADPAPRSTVEVTRRGPEFNIHKKEFRHCPTPKCDCRTHEVLHKGGIFFFRCGNWGCDECKHLHMEHWAATIQHHVRQWDIKHPGNPLYFFTCEEKDWTKKLRGQTKGCSFVRFTSSDNETTFVLTTILPMQIRQRGPVAYTVCDAKEGVARAVHVLRNIPLSENDKRKTISSHDWKLIGQTKSENKGWKRKFAIRSPWNIQKVLKGHGITEDKQRHRDVSKNEYQPCTAIQFDLPVVESAKNNLLCDLREGELVSKIELDWGGLRGRHNRSETIVEEVASKTSMGDTPASAMDAYYNGAKTTASAASSSSTAIMDESVFFNHLFAPDVSQALSSRHPPSHASPIPD